MFETLVNGMAHVGIKNFPTHHLPTFIHSFITADTVPTRRAIKACNFNKEYKAMDNNSLDSWYSIQGKKLEVAPGMV